MRNLKRAITASALALPLTLGAGGVAAADSFESEQAGASSQGAMSQSVQSSTDGSDPATQGTGGASFDQRQGQAGPDGASSERTSSSTDGQGNAGFEHEQSQAGPDGASSSSTSANAGGSNVDDGDSDNDGVLGGLLNIG